MQSGQMERLRTVLTVLLVSVLSVPSFGSTAIQAQAEAGVPLTDPDAIAARTQRERDALALEIDTRQIVNTFMEPGSSLSQSDLMSYFTYREDTLVSSATKVRTVAERLVREGKLTPERAAQLLKPSPRPYEKPLNEGLDFSNPTDVHIWVLRLVQRRHSEYLSDQAMEESLRPKPNPRAAQPPSSTPGTLSPMWQVALVAMFYAIANHRPPSERGGGAQSCYSYEFWNGKSCEFDTRMRCDQVAILDFVNAANCKPGW